MPFINVKTDLVDFESYTASVLSEFIHVTWMSRNYSERPGEGGKYKSGTVFLQKVQKLEETCHRTWKILDFAVSVLLILRTRTKQYSGAKQIGTAAFVQKSTMGKRSNEKSGQSSRYICSMLPD